MLRLYRDISQFDRKCNGKKLCSQNLKFVCSYNAILYAMIIFNVRRKIAIFCFVYKIINCNGNIFLFYTVLN